MNLLWLYLFYTAIVVVATGTLFIYAVAEKERTRGICVIALFLCAIFGFAIGAEISERTLTAKPVPKEIIDKPEKLMVNNAIEVPGEVTQMLSDTDAGCWIILCKDSSIWQYNRKEHGWVKIKEGTPTIEKGIK